MKCWAPGANWPDASGAPLYAVLLGSEAAPLAAKLGVADKVFVVDNPQLNLAPANTIAAVLKALMEQTQAGMVLLGCTNVSLGVGSILSAKASLPLVNFCRAAKAEGGGAVFTSQLFGGKILSDVKLADGRGIISIYPGAFPADAGKSDKTPPVEKVDVPRRGAEGGVQAVPRAGNRRRGHHQAERSGGRGARHPDARTMCNWPKISRRFWAARSAPRGR